MHSDNLLLNCDGILKLVSSIHGAHCSVIDMHLFKLISPMVSMYHSKTLCISRSRCASLAGTQNAKVGHCLLLDLESHVLLGLHRGGYDASKVDV